MNNFLKIFLCTVLFNGGLIASLVDPMRIHAPLIGATPEDLAPWLTIEWESGHYDYDDPIISRHYTAHSKQNINFAGKQVHIGLSASFSLSGTPHHIVHMSIVEFIYRDGFYYNPRTESEGQNHWLHLTSDLFSQELPISGDISNPESYIPELSKILEKLSNGETLEFPALDLDMLLPVIINPTPMISCLYSIISSGLCSMLFITKEMDA